MCSWAPSCPSPPGCWDTGCSTRAEIEIQLRHADCKVLARTFYSSKTFYKMLKSASLQHSQDQSSLLQWIAICAELWELQYNAMNATFRASAVSKISTYLYYLQYLQYLRIYSIRPSALHCARPLITMSQRVSAASQPDIVWWEQPDFVLNLRSFATFSLPTLDRN